MTNNNHLKLMTPFARLFIPVAAVILFFAIYLDDTQASNKQQALMNNEHLRISQQLQTIHQTFDNIIADLVILSKHNDFEHISIANINPSNQHVQELAQEFKQFHIHKPHYDQIRFLNLSGMEIIRTNRFNSDNGSSIEIVAPNKLQSKKHRPYFTQTVGLSNQEVHISPMELNIEHRKIQQPIKPTIRFSIPLFDSKGVKFGILTLNYNASSLFQQLKESGLKDGLYLSLLNNQGYWLEDADTSRTWGFMYTGGSNNTFKHQHPQLWKTISTSPSGQIMHRDGLFTFSQVHPLASIKKRLNDNTPAELLYRAIPKTYTWILISHIPAATVAAIIRPSATIYNIVTASLLAIWFIIALILVQQQAVKKDTQRQLAEKDSHIRHIVDAAMNGIITINEHGIIESFNPAAAQMFGYDQDEAIGQNIAMIVSSADEKTHDAYIQRYIDTREAHIVGKPREVIAKCKDGRLFPIELFVTARQIDDHWLFVGILHDISERKAMQAKLIELATTDGLTGLFNRAHFNDKLNEEFKRAKRYQQHALSLMILDADHFKSVNDYYGHPAGDALLIAIARMAQQCARETDVVARYGGEEFVIIMPDSNANEALQLAERLRKAIAELEIEYEGNNINRTVSIGIACLQESDKDSDMLLSRADQALYHAKESGRNKAVLN
ncbi:MAG: diguanylate cyclase [Mariprofundus sp.]|nr:diguanylate cyclase [Mariprofundus sp.]